MMMTWRRPEGRQEAREGDGILLQEEAWMTIEQEDTIVHPFVLRQFPHNAASRLISHDGDPRSSNLESSITLISGSSSLKLLTTRENFPEARPTLIISVFFGLTMRPIRLNPVMHLCTSLRTDSGEPPMSRHRDTRRSVLTLLHWQSDQLRVQTGEGRSGLLVGGLSTRLSNDRMQ